MTNWVIMQSFDIIKECNWFFLHNKIIDVMIIMDTNFIAKNTEMVIIVAFASL